jgi:hypothetical protein
MPPSKYPNGITSFGVPLMGNDSLVPITTGSVFWVDANSGFGNGDGSFERPFSKLANAYAACTTLKGDIIIMKPGHAETITANTALTFDKNYVSVIGLGQGSLRPTITLTGTTAAVTITVSGANQLFRNFIVTSGVAELVAAWTISGAYCTLDAVDYAESNATFTCITAITTTADGNWLTVTNCNFKAVTTAVAAGFAVTLTGADDCVIMNNIFNWLCTDAASSGSIGMVGTACLRVWIIGNLCTNAAGTTCVSILGLAGSSGMMANNLMANPNAATQGAMVGIGNMALMENYSGTTGTTQGVLDPAAGI